MLPLATCGTSPDPAGAVTFGTWVWSKESHHMCTDIHSEANTPVPGHSLGSLNFHVHQVGNTHPWAHQQGVLGRSHSWLHWRASAGRAVGGWGTSTPVAALLGQQQGAAGRSQGTASTTLWALTVWQVDRLCQIACEPANKSSRVNGVSRQLSSHRCCFHFQHQEKQGWDSAERQGRGQLAFVHSDFLWRHQRSLSQNWLHCLLQCESCLIKET